MPQWESGTYLLDRFAAEFGLNRVEVKQEVPGQRSYGIAEHFTKHGFLFCVDAHRDGKRFIVKADDLLTAFLSLERDVIAPKVLTGTRRGLAFLFFPASE